MKRKSDPDWEWEKKPRKVEKGSNKENKHRKSIYNMLSDSEDLYDDETDSENGDEDYGTTREVRYYNKRR